MNDSPTAQMKPDSPDLVERCVDAICSIMDMLDRLAYSGCYGNTEEGFQRWLAEQQELENDE